MSSEKKYPEETEMNHLWTGRKASLHSKGMLHIWKKIEMKLCITNSFPQKISVEVLFPGGPINSQQSMKNLQIV